MQKPIFNPHVPYIGPIYGGKFVHQKMVRIQGTVPSVAYRFNINLQCGSQEHPQSDIAMQISIRLLDNYVVLNSLENGIWGEELRKSTSPVQCGKNFQILVLCDSNQYMVAINGQHFCEFPQRIHYNRISHLAIHGDVSITQISYEPASGTSQGEASAPTLTPPVDNSDDFELVDSSGAPLLNRPPPAPLRGAHPPSYGMIVSDNSRMPPQPKPFAAVPHSSSTTPYSYGNVGAPSGPPYAGVPGGNRLSPNPPGIYAPPLSATVPLNSPGSPLRPVKRISGKKCCYYCCSILLGVIFIIVIVVCKVGRSYDNYNQEHSNSDYNDYHNNYRNNDYDYDN